MSQPFNGAVPQRFELRNSAGKNVAFMGLCIAEVSNYNPNTRDENGVATGSKRWKERAVYVTKGGSVVCHKLGRSNVPGETDRGEVLVLKRPEGSRIGELSPNLGSSIMEFFAGDSLAKDLFAQLAGHGVSDVEEID